MTAADRTPEPADGEPTAGHTAIQHYEIRVKGHLDDRWSAWFDGLAIATEPGGTTAIRGPVADQAALHGLLQRLRDVGIPLISLTPIPADAPRHNEGN